MKIFNVTLIVLIFIGVNFSLDGSVYFRGSTIISAIYWFIRFSKNRHFFIRYESLLLLILIFSGLLPIMYNYHFSTHSYVNSLYFIFLGITMIDVIVNSISLSDLILSLNIILAINVAIGLYEVLTGNHLPYVSIINYNVRFNNVPIGLFFNQNDYGIFLSLLVPFVINQKINRFYKYITIILMLFLIFATGSNGAIILLIMNLFIQFAYSLKYLKSQDIFIRFFIIMVSVILVVLLVQRFVEIEYLMLKLSRISSIENIITVSRLNILKDYFFILIRYPFGVGLGQSTIINYALNGSHINSHSFFLEIFVELGIISGIVIISMYFYAIFKVISKRLITPISVFVFSSLITFPLWSNIPSRIVEGFDIFWLLIGLTILQLKYKGVDDEKN